MASGFQVPAVFKAIDRMTTPIKTMARGVQGFARQSSVAVNRVDRKFIGLGKTIKNVVGGFGLFLGGAALFGVLSSGIGVIVDYEQANANLASVLGITIDQTKSLQKESLRLGATTSFTAAEVAGLQTAYAKLGFVQTDIIAMTGATLDLAAATQTELPQAALQVGAAIRAFGLDATEATRVSNVFAAATSKSALDMVKLDVAMSKVAPVAAKFGFEIEETVALMGKLSDAGFDASTMATSTRSILLNLADSNGKLSKALGGPAKNLEEVTAGLIKLKKKGIDLAGMLNLTDKRSVAAFATFLDGAEGIRQLNKDITGTNAAGEMAAKQLDTLKGRATILNSAWEGLILSLDTGNGTFSTAAKGALDLATEVLALAAGTAIVTSELDGTQKALRENAEMIITVLKWTKNLVLGYLALKTIMFTVRAAYAVYSVALGIATALQLSSTIALKGNLLALSAARIATVGITAAQWLWNAAMAANPIGLIIAAVIALGALIYFAIKQWESWGAAVSLFLGPIGLVVAMIQSFRMHWEAVTRSFSTGGMLTGFKAIALVLADGILKPVEQLLGLINKFTGIDLGLAAIGGIRSNISSSLGEESVPSPEGVPSINPVATREETLIQRSESTESKVLKIDIGDPNGIAKVNDSESSSGLDVFIEPSFITN